MVPCCQCLVLTNMGWRNLGGDKKIYVIRYCCGMSILCESVWVKKSWDKKIYGTHYCCIISSSVKCLPPCLQLCTVLKPLWHCKQVCWMVVVVVFPCIGLWGKRLNELFPACNVVFHCEVEVSWHTPVSLLRPPTACFSGQWGVLRIDTLTTQFGHLATAQTDHAVWLTDYCTDWPRSLADWLLYRLTTQLGWLAAVQTDHPVRLTGYWGQKQRSS